MIYIRQEIGEAENESGGFGSRSRTFIFDYIGYQISIVGWTMANL